MTPLADNSMGQSQNFWLTFIEFYLEFVWPLNFSKGKEKLIGWRLKITLKTRVHARMLE